MEKWLRRYFESSSGKTPQFKEFVSDLRNYFRKNIPGCLISVGHFEVSGFYTNPDTGHMCYFSMSDVRFFRDEWYTHVLYRTAEHAKDYTGGQNRYCSLPELSAKMKELTAIPNL